MPGCCLLCMQTTGCMAEYFTTAGYFYKTSTSATEFVSRQPNIVDSFRSFELVCKCMEMLNKRWYHIHSHQHCPSSVLRAAPQSVSASPYKLYSRPPCIVLNSCFWFRPGIGQSLGIEPVTDVPPDRAARVLSACQELEKVACNNLYLRKSVTACLGNYLPSVVFCVARE